MDASSVAEAEWNTQATDPTGTSTTAAAITNEEEDVTARDVTIIRQHQQPLQQEQEQEQEQNGIQRPQQQEEQQHQHEAVAVVNPVPENAITAITTSSMIQNNHHSHHPVVTYLLEKMLFNSPFHHLWRNHHHRNLYSTNNSNNNNNNINRCTFPIVTLYFDTKKRVTVAVLSCHLKDNYNDDDNGEDETNLTLQSPDSRSTFMENNNNNSNINNNMNTNFSQNYNYHRSVRMLLASYFRYRMKQCTAIQRSSLYYELDGYIRGTYTELNQWILAGTESAGNSSSTSNNHQNHNNNNNNNHINNSQQQPVIITIAVGALLESDIEHTKDLCNQRQLNLQRFHDYYYYYQYHHHHSTRGSNTDYDAVVMMDQEEETRTESTLLELNKPQTMRTHMTRMRRGEENEDNKNKSNKYRYDIMEKAFNIACMCRLEADLDVLSIYCMYKTNNSIFCTIAQRMIRHRITTSCSSIYSTRGTTLSSRSCQSTLSSTSPCFTIRPYVDGVSVSGYSTFVRRGHSITTISSPTPPTPPTPPPARTTTATRARTTTTTTTTTTATNTNSSLRRPLTAIPIHTIWIERHNETGRAIEYERLPDVPIVFNTGCYGGKCHSSNTRDEGNISSVSKQNSLMESQVVLPSPRPRPLEQNKYGDQQQQHTCHTTTRSCACDTNSFQQNNNDTITSNPNVTINKYNKNTKIRNIHSLAPSSQSDGYISWECEEFQLPNLHCGEWGDIFLRKDYIGQKFIIQWHPSYVDCTDTEREQIQLQQQQVQQQQDGIDVSSTLFSASLSSSIIDVVRTLAVVRIDTTPKDVGRTLIIPMIMTNGTSSSKNNSSSSTYVTRNPVKVSNSSGHGTGSGGNNICCNSSLSSRDTESLVSQSSLVLRVHFSETRLRDTYQTVHAGTIEIVSFDLDWMCLVRVSAQAMISSIERKYSTIETYRPILPQEQQYRQLIQQLASL